MMLAVIAVIGSTFLWQSDANQKQSVIDAETTETYISPAAEFIFQVPKTWSTSQEASVESEGIIGLLLEGPRNEEIGAAFTKSETGDKESVEESISSGRFDELIASPFGREFVLLEVDVITSTFYDLTPTKEQWKSELLEANKTATGIAFGSFTDFSTEGADGYKYELKIIEDGKNLNAIGYYLLGEAAEAEFLVFPADTTYAAEAEEIINSVIISPDIAKSLEESGVLN